MFLLMYGRVTTPGTESGKKEKVREHQPSLVSSLVLLPDPETVKRNMCVSTGSHLSPLTQLLLSAGKSSFETIELKFIKTSHISPKG